MTTVEVGQVWLDWDSRFRDKGYERKIKVLRIEGEYAYCDSYGKTVRIKLKRFKPNSTGYKLFKS